MTESWDAVAKYVRRQRRRRFLSGLALLTSTLILLFALDLVPFQFLGGGEDDNKNAEPHDSTTAHPRSEPHGNGPDARFAEPKERAAPDGVTAEAPAITDKTDASGASADDSVTVSDPVEDPPEPASPKEDVDPALLARVERTQSYLNRRLEQLDGDDDRLNRFGGEKWASIKSLKQIAFQIDDPGAALKAAEDALGQVGSLALTVDIEELLAKTKGREPAEALATLVAFQKNHSDHPPIPELEGWLNGLSRETWLAMADDELTNASPDDSGFAEGWMPIAKAWQLVGKDAEAREAIRRAREALPRMTRVERAIESSIDLCQHESFDPAFSEQLINNAAQMCQQVSTTSARSTYHAHLSGLAAKLGHRSLAAKLRQESLEPLDIDDGGATLRRLSFVQQCRIASWTEPPETILAICQKIDRATSSEPVINASAYAHAAISAARHNDRTRFLRGMFKAETAIAPVRIQDYPNYLAGVRTAEANILRRRWRAAVIIANNIPALPARASILFRVMKDAPQEVRSPHLAELFEECANQRWASQAMAAYMEHRMRSGEDLLDLVVWAQQLKLASQRASAYVGVARATGSTSTGKDVSLANIPVTRHTDITDAISLVEAAEQRAAAIEDPLESAFVWLQIARTWNLLGKTLRYRTALTRIDDRLFDVWTNVWNDRPSVKRSYNGGYIYSDDRHRRKEEETVGMITECHWHLAEMQADIGDAQGTMETCLDFVNTAGFRHDTTPSGDLNFLRLNALATRLRSETGIGPDVFPLGEHRDRGYTRVLMAALAKDIRGLQAAIPEVVERSKHARPARAYAELAILHAERGNIDGYRDARRRALSEITQGKAYSEMRIALATADALAGEFVLAESNLVRGDLGWYGDANRPRTQLVIALANDGQWKKATEHAMKIPTKYPLYRGDAWEAIAKARFNDKQQSRDELLDWVESLHSSVDQAGAFRGLALAVGTSQP